MEICIIGFQLKIINMNNDNNGPSYLDLASSPGRSSFRVANYDSLNDYLVGLTGQTLAEGLLRGQTINMHCLVL